MKVHTSLGSQPQKRPQASSAQIAPAINVNVHNTNPIALRRKAAPSNCCGVPTCFKMRCHARLPLAGAASVPACAEEMVSTPVVAVAETASAETVESLAKVAALAASADVALAARGRVAPAASVGRGRAASGDVPPAPRVDAAPFSAGSRARPCLSTISCSTEIKKATVRTPTEMVAIET